MLFSIFHNAACASMTHDHNIALELTYQAKNIFEKRLLSISKEFWFKDQKLYSE